MDLQKYEGLINATAIFPKESGITYCTLGLVGEAGEVAEKMKKVIRDGGGILTDEKKKEIVKELGDVVWYITALAKELDSSLTEVMSVNYDKLISRKERGVLKGSGDNR